MLHFSGTFILEYVGEVLQYEEFVERTVEYEKKDQKHFYFMALNTDEIIDASLKGNNSRFINHCCDPNAETQKVSTSV
jgi:histone-lysine N-methyltransferase SETD2